MLNTPVRESAWTLTSAAAKQRIQNGASRHDGDPCKRIRTPSAAGLIMLAYQVM